MKKLKFYSVIAAAFVGVAAIVVGAVWLSFPVGANASSSDDTTDLNAFIAGMEKGQVYNLWGYDFLCVDKGDNSYIGENSFVANEIANGKTKIKTLWMTGRESVRFQKLSRWAEGDTDDNVYNANTYLHKVYNSRGSLSANITTSVYKIFEAADPVLTSFISPGFKKGINNAGFASMVGGSGNYYLNTASDAYNGIALTDNMSNPTTDLDDNKPLSDTAKNHALAKEYNSGDDVVNYSTGWSSGTAAAYDLGATLLND
ncbi:MAG: hypothetical protein LBH47_00900, partial [Christensenellaceae bacterium]|nr:hypothetical protein [Christensenellaceae bacterium]